MTHVAGKSPSRRLERLQTIRACDHRFKSSSLIESASVLGVQNDDVGCSVRPSGGFLDMHLEKGTNSKDIGSAPTVQGSSPQHQAFIANGFDLPKSVSTDIQVRYVSALPGIKVPSYWTGNATVRWAGPVTSSSRPRAGIFFSHTTWSLSTIPDLRWESSAPFMARSHSRDDPGGWRPPRRRVLLSQHRKL